MGSRNSSPEAGPGGAAAAEARTAAVVLAAGAGTRFHGATHKLLAPVDESPLVRHAVGAAVEADIGPVIVVTGAVPLDDALAGLDLEVIADNVDFATGQASSLQVGLAAADRLGVDAVVVAPGDQLGVTPSAWRAVAASSDRPVAVAVFGGQRRPPTRLDRTIWPLLPHTGDEGARALFRGRPDLVREVPCVGTPRDIDTVEEYRRWT